MFLASENREGQHFRVDCDPGHLQSFETLSRVWQETEEKREWVYRALSANLGHRGGRRGANPGLLKYAGAGDFLERLRLRGGNPEGGGDAMRGLRSWERREKADLGQASQPVQQLWEILTKKVQIKWKENFSFIIARDKAAAGVKWGQQTSSSGVTLTRDSMG